ncbi:molybdenum cofactor guanylyltransferase [SAR202 cluster bacterium AC-647-N09_OGT_505m]|nr:molybdenum cofactor guanylyltransferase [SAR202 cluster bacterium AC-647-N09_OGT_505m]
MSNQFDTRDMDAIVLAGGESKRMGFPKAFLTLGNITPIETIITRLQSIFRTVLVAARDSNGLTDLDAVILTDQRMERGPLVGVAQGLAVSDAPWCFVVGCDMPFLRKDVIQRMALNLEDCDVLAPNVDSHLQPLHAFYSPRCLPIANRLLDSGVTSLQAIFPSCNVKALQSDLLLDIDPDLISFRDLDTVDDYQAALKLTQ